MEHGKFYLIGYVKILSFGIIAQQEVV